MFFSRFSAVCGLLLVSGLASAEVRVQGSIEYGLFQTQHQNFQPGERVLTQSTQTLLNTSEIPARLGSKFGMRYRLEGKAAEDTPLTLLYLTPGVLTPDGKRHDKFEVVQKLVPGAAQDVMAYEFTELHEVVPGEWHFMVFQGDRLLAEQRFTVR
ncbi:DUF3859 domain-containing protein [Pseudomonas arcuscaelestis]|uniref:DUF3859 domain-containing protein n=1 Tax=Pseudomonas arcuscaelestis TaxID=2710591 RepID=UPI00193D00A1|nr:DUF3859 domain-containing protein [Pseudomonas arcuscaelestis]MBM3113222.1 DUF3859 domain-containing protein [Pseudomonas arcuscaelestis]